MTNPSGRTLEEVLFKRQEVLSALVGESRTKPELVDHLDVPRSTLDDIVRDLSDAGLVEYADGRWQSTLVGACAWEMYQSYAERIASLADAVSILDGRTVEGLDCAMLDGCTVFENDSALLDGIVREFTERLRTAERLRGLVPQALAGHVPAASEAILADEPTAIEMVFNPDVYDDVVAMYPDAMRDALERDYVEHFRAPIPFSYGLWIADDDHAGVAIYGESGIQGIIINDTPAALAWAAETYDEVRETAEPVSDLPSQACDD